MTSCYCLGILHYHDKVERWRGGKKIPVQKTSGDSSKTKEAKVPAVRVNLVQSVHLFPHQSRMVDIEVS